MLMIMHNGEENMSQRQLKPGVLVVSVNSVFAMNDWN